MNRYLLDAARKFADRTAIVQGKQAFAYRDVAARSLSAKNEFSKLGVKRGDRVCVFGESSVDYVATQLGLWRLGAVSVTLLPSYPVTELEYFVRDSDSKLVVATDTAKAHDIVRSLGSKDVGVVSPQVLVSNKVGADFGLDTHGDCNLQDEEAACLIYTSGSTSKPKGVVTTHGALKAMVDGMAEFWEWSKEDHILHFLPLHHVHGAINKLLTPLAVGAKVEFVHFDASKILTRLNASNDRERPTVFMGVPTVYAKLVDDWEKDGSPDLVNLQKLRLFVCGSAPLPVPLFEIFSQQIAKQPILERYGMTEIGMALSNPYRPLEARHAGCVGVPMPGVEVRITDLDIDPEGEVSVAPDHPGDLLIRGKTVFKTYWGNAAKLTETEFTKSGWFKTGDVAVFDSKLNSYKIVGRKSVDVIKSGGYKISAIEIERVLLGNKQIDEAAVLGIPDNIWGESVVAIVVPKKGTPLTEKSVQEYATKHLVKYKVPRKVLIMTSIPKNAMGKFNKKELRNIFKDKS